MFQSAGKLGILEVYHALRKCVRPRTRQLASYLNVVSYSERTMLDTKPLMSLSRTDLSIVKRLLPLIDGFSTF